MPFTFCHPAIILPLAKLNSKRISATGLIIGSMSPDFEYFLKMRLEKIHGHSLGGLFYFDLPLTILLAFIFHLGVRKALILHSPEVIRKKFIQFVDLDWISWVKRHWYVLIYSSLIGIFSHIFWDAFTHTNGFFVRHLTFLQGSTDIFGVIIRKADLAQTLSTLVGGIVILIALLIPPFDTLNRSLFVRKIKYWTLVFTILCITLFFRNMSSLGDFVATFISGGLIGLIVAPMLLFSVRKMN